MLAASTWVITLAINLNPFMRMDGYYLLADWVRVENLQPRAFAYNRWHLRRLLFGLDAPPPEILPAKTARFFIIYAWCTWIYRLMLFLGIALLVYHFAFKLLGILLMAVEVGWFVARPIVREVWAWAKLAPEAFEHRRSRVSLGLFGTALLLLLLPWQTRVSAPALLKAEQYAEIFVPFPARLDSLPVASGQRAEAGQALADLSSADLAYKAQQADNEAALLQWQLAYHGMEKSLISTHQVLLKELESAGAKLAGFREQQQQLAVRAGFSGVVLDVNPEVQPGQWLKEGEKLMVLAAPESLLLEAYLAEDDLLPVEEGAQARFYPDDASLAAIPCRVTRVDHAASTGLPAYFASVYGGEVAARLGPNRAATPDSAVYRLLLKPESNRLPTRLPHMLRGKVYVESGGRSLLLRAWRHAAAVLIRESGF